MERKSVGSRFCLIAAGEEGEIGILREARI